MLEQGIVFLVNLVGFSIVIPQLIKALCTENISRISPDLLLVLLFISIVTLFYSVLTNSGLILVVNLISSLFYSSILYIQFKKKHINF